MKKEEIKYKRIRLANGLKVILLKRPEKYTASLSGYFRAGSAYENKEISGVSHFVEHLLFRGNKKFKTAQDVDKEKDRLGLSYEANTDYDRVRYRASFPPEEIEDVLRFSAFALFESLLEKTEIEKECQVMIEEEKLREDNLEVRSWDLTLKTRLKDRAHPLTLPREGLLKSIKTLKPPILKIFYQKHFQAANLTLVVGSSLEFTKLQKIVGQVFKKFSSSSKGKLVPIKFDIQDFSSFVIATEKRNIEKAYLNFTFPAFSYDRPLKDRLAINLLSRIFQRIRLDQRLYQEKGLSYDWNCGWSVPTHPIGIFWIYSSCDPQNLEEIIKIFFEELKKLHDKKVAQNELERARDYLNKVSPMEFDSLSGAVEWVLDDFFYYGHFYSPEEIILARNELTAKFLFNVANEIIDFRKLNVAVLGPVIQKSVEKMVAKQLDKS